MRATVVKEFDFPASHANSHHPGHCSRVHGHTWVLRVYAEGPVELTDINAPNYGMVIDFQTLKEAYQEVIEPYVEHQHLNDTLQDAVSEFTTELIAAWILKQLRKRIPQVTKVRLYEGRTSFAEVRAGDLIRSARNGEH